MLKFSVRYNLSLSDRTYEPIASFTNSKMSFNAQILCQLIDKVDTQLKVAIGTGAIEKEFRKERKNIVS